LFDKQIDPLGGDIERGPQMEMVGRADTDQIELLGGQQFFMAGVNVHLLTKPGSDRAGQVEIAVDNGDQPGAWLTRKDRGMHRTHEACADHGDAELSSHAVSPDWTRAVATALA